MLSRRPIADTGVCGCVCVRACVRACVCGRGWGFDTCDHCWMEKHGTVQKSQSSEIKWLFPERWCGLMLRGTAGPQRSSVERVHGYVIRFMV